MFSYRQDEIKSLARIWWHKYLSSYYTGTLAQENPHCLAIVKMKLKGLARIWWNTYFSFDYIDAQ